MANKSHHNPVDIIMQAVTSNVASNLSRDGTEVGKNSSKNSMLSDLHNHTIYLSIIECLHYHELIATNVQILH